MIKSILAPRKNMSLCILPPNMETLQTSIVGKVGDKFVWEVDIQKVENIDDGNKIVTRVSIEFLTENKEGFNEQMPLGKIACYLTFEKN